MIKNDIVTLTINGYASGGDGVAHPAGRELLHQAVGDGHSTPPQAANSPASDVGTGRGRAVFVRRALRGETVEAHILKVSKTAIFAKVARVITPSPERLEPECPHYNLCGGCALQHMSYAEELRYKRERVADALQRLGGVTVELPECIPSPSIAGYRNKAIFEVSVRNGAARIGFYREHSHDIISVTTCLIQSEAANLAADTLREWVAQQNVADGAIRGLFVRDGDGGIQVALVTPNKKLAGIQAFIEMLTARLTKPVSVMTITQKVASNVALSGELRRISGTDFLEDTMHVAGNELRFRLSPRSFYQVNRAQAEQLYDEAIRLAALREDDVALDLYCGAGTITLALAKSAPKSVRLIGAEIVADAVENARENARLNGITNAEFILADVVDTATNLAAQGITPRVVVVDPPRKGLAPQVIVSIAAMLPERIVYVSCDPATLARDIKLFAAEGYGLTEARAFDMFPRCAHVESVVLLSRNR